MMEAKETALALWEDGYKAQMDRDYTKAKALYVRSIEVFPTAEAHTFLGWLLSWQGDVEGAIRECFMAIEVDPEYGNPYNDIGSYLMQQGRIDEAIPWFEKAKAAERYDARVFPYVNLAKAYEQKQLWSEAVGEYQAALGIDPKYKEAFNSLSLLLSKLN